MRNDPVLQLSSPDRSRAGSPWGVSRRSSAPSHQRKLALGPSEPNPADLGEVCFPIAVSRAIGRISTAPAIELSVMALGHSLAQAIRRLRRVDYINFGLSVEQRIDRRVFAVEPTCKSAKTGFWPTQTATRDLPRDQAVYSGRNARISSTRSSMLICAISFSALSAPRTGVMRSRVFALTASVFRGFSLEPGGNLVK